MNCLFCEIGKKNISSYILYEDEHYMAFLDQNQDCFAHTLIIPKEHLEDITKVSKDMLKEMYEIALKISEQLKEKCDVKGFSYMINYLNNQDIKHVHLHILPDYLKKGNDKSIEEVFKMIKGN